MHPVTILLHVSSHYRFDGVTALKIDGGYLADLISSPVRPMKLARAPVALSCHVFAGPKGQGRQIGVVTLEHCFNFEKARHRSVK